MNTTEALKLVGGLSKPSKMPGWAYGIPAAECKTGKKLQEVPGSTCFGCYATKGCYVFPVVQAAQYRRLAAIKNPLWVEAMATLINSNQNGLDGTIPETCKTLITFLRSSKFANLHRIPDTGCQHVKRGLKTSWTRFQGT
jgi:hypothetical protein